VPERQPHPALEHTRLFLWVSTPPNQYFFFVLPFSLSSFPTAARPARRAAFSCARFVILEQGKIYPMMSGHNAICVATALLESGMVRAVFKNSAAHGALFATVAQKKLYTRHV